MTWREFLKIAATAACAGLMAGCSSGDAGMPEAGLAGGAFQEDSFDGVDLVAQLDPDGMVQARIGRKEWKTLDDGAKIDMAFEAFYRDYPPSTRTLHRNRVQERLLAASATACARLKADLMAQKRHGAWAAVAGVTKATTRIVTGVNTSRVLTGVYGIFAGAEGFNEELFTSLTTQVVVSGIENRRRYVRDRIEETRRRSDIAAYTVEAAVKDALFYHDQCNVFVGMMAARDMMIADRDS